MRVKIFWSNGETTVATISVHMSLETMNDFMAEGVSHVELLKVDR